MASEEDRVDYQGMSEAQAEMARRLIGEFNQKAHIDMDGEAFAGILHRCGSLPPLAAYDMNKCLDLLHEGGVDPEQVEDTFSYGTLRALPHGGENAEAYISFGCDDGACYESAEEVEEFEDALLGLVTLNGFPGGVAGYDKKKCIEILMQQSETSLEEAEQGFKDWLTTFKSKVDDEELYPPVFLEMVEGYKPLEHWG